MNEDVNNSSNILDNNIFKDTVTNIKNDALISSTKLDEKINNDWVIMIRDSIPYIDKIFNDPKRFIKTEEEILNIEKIKKVSTESVKHLAKHANFVDDFNEKTGYVRPSRILNVYKEDTFNTYENRFIFTLVEYISTFLDIMEKKINSLNNSLTDKFDYKSRTNISNELVDYDFHINSFRKINNNNDSKTLEDILFCKKALSGWKQTELYKTLLKERVIRVTSPIKRTNVILKNPNFQVAAKLWDYLHKYQYILDDEVTPQMTLDDIPLEYKKRIENSFLSSYYIMKILTSKSKESTTRYNQKLESLNYTLLKDSIDVLVNNTDLTKEKILSLVSNQYDYAKKIKVADTSIIEKEIKSLAGDYLQKIDSIYFDLGDDIE